MRFSSTLLFASCLVAIGVTGVASAGPREEAEAAAERGDLAAAARLYRIAADAGSAEAQYEIGFRTRYGHGVMSDAAESLRWYRLAAKQGEPRAMYQLGNHYFGEGEMSPNRPEALRLLQAAADRGLPVAMDTLGYYYSSGRGVPKDGVRAERLYRTAAEKGYIASYYALGLMYDAGLSVARDAAKASQLFSEAAARGMLVPPSLFAKRGIPVPASLPGHFPLCEAEAEHEIIAGGPTYIVPTGFDLTAPLGLVRKAGINRAPKIGIKLLSTSKPMPNGYVVRLRAVGLDPDGDTLIYDWSGGDSIQWNGWEATMTVKKPGRWQAFAQVSDERGCTRGAMLGGGAGPPRSTTEIVAEIAKVRAESDAAYERGDFEAALLPTMFVAMKGDADAMYRLGQMKWHGYGVKQDFKAAIEIYREAADKGNGDAMSALGFIYERGLQVPKDPQQSIRWDRAAAAKGNASAMDRLGQRYDRGLGVTPNRAEAIRWYRAAGAKGNYESYIRLADLYRVEAEKGDPEVMTELGILYFNGVGVNWDPAQVQANRWFKAAAEKGVVRAMGYLAVNSEAVEALRWSKAAADRNYPLAMHNLAMMYELGGVLKVDSKQADLWYGKAARFGFGPSIAQVRRRAQIAKGTLAATAMPLEWKKPGARCSRYFEVEESGRDKLLLLNRPPVVSMKATVTSDKPLGSTLRLRTIVTDPDNDPLVYTYSSTGGTVAGDGSTVTWKLPSSGFATVSVEVNDRRGCITFSSFSHEVGKPVSN